jgi:3-oxoadipate enol-lactonase
MFVWESGGGNSVLFLHGTPSPAADWLPIAEALAPRYRVLVPELPGYGRSPALVDSSMESVGDAIAAMLRERGIAELAAVVGYSTGVYRAFDLIIRHRIPTRAVIALAGVVTFDEQGRALRRQLAEQLEADPAAIDSPAWHDLMRVLMLSESWRAAHPEDEQRVIGWLHTTTVPALIAELRALAAMRDLRPELASVEASVVARVGDADVGAPPEVSREIVELVPHGELEIVSGVGHGLMIEDADATKAAVVRHVEAHGAGRPR